MSLQQDSTLSRKSAGSRAARRDARDAVRGRGFTLIEMLVTIAIVGILASIALSSYTGYITRSRLSEAFEGLTNYRLRMEQGFQDAGNYGNLACAVTLPPTTKHFGYTCAVGDAGTTFVATATGTDSMAGYTFTVNDAGTQSTTAFPKASGLPAACWLTRVGDC